MVSSFFQPLVPTLENRFSRHNTTLMSCRQFAKSCLLFNAWKGHLVNFTTHWGRMLAQMHHISQGYWTKKEGSKPNGFLEWCFMPSQNCPVFFASLGKCLAWHETFLKRLIQKFPIKADQIWANILTYNWWPAPKDELESDDLSKVLKYIDKYRVGCFKQNAKRFALNISVHLRTGTLKNLLGDELPFNSEI